MRLSLWCVLSLLPLCAITCGNRRPVVYNGLCEDIQVEVTWEDGTTSSGALPYASSAFLSSPPNYPSKITVELPDGSIYEFTEANAPDLIGGEVTGQIIGWRATDSNLVALTEEELEEGDDRLAPRCGERDPSSK